MSLMRVLATAGKNDLEQHIIKATYVDDMRPKEKHVRALIDLSLGDPQYDFARDLAQRLAEPEWNVVLKTLAVIHRLCRDAHPNFMQLMAQYSHMLNKGTFVDRSSTEAWGECKVIRGYSDYLAEKLYVYKILGTNGERQPARESKEWIDNMNVNQFMEALPLLQVQFRKLLDVTPYVEEVALHPIAANAFQLLILDAHRLYTMFNLLFLRVVDEVKRLSKSQAETALKAFYQFIDDNDKFRKWSDNLVHLQLVEQDHLPDFDDLAKTQDGVIKVLTARVRDAGPSVARSASATTGSGSLRKNESNSNARRPAVRTDVEEDPDDEADEELNDHSPSRQPSRGGKPGPVKGKPASNVARRAQPDDEYEDADDPDDEEEDGEEDEDANPFEQQTRKPAGKNSAPPAPKSAAVSRGQQQQAPVARQKSALDEFDEAFKASTAHQAPPHAGVEDDFASMALNSRNRPAAQGGPSTDHFEALAAAGGRRGSGSYGGALPPTATGPYGAPAPYYAAPPFDPYGGVPPAAAPYYPPPVAADPFGVPMGYGAAPAPNAGPRRMSNSYDPFAGLSAAGPAPAAGAVPANKPASKPQAGKPAANPFDDLGW